VLDQAVLDLLLAVRREDSFRRHIVRSPSPASRFRWAMAS
jgi:hypothetical protein